MAVITIDTFRMMHALLALLFGIIIISWKKSLNYLVGTYFLLVALLEFLYIF